MNYHHRVHELRIIARLLESGTGKNLGNQILGRQLNVGLLILVSTCPEGEIEIWESLDQDPPGILAIASSNALIAQEKFVIGVLCLVPTAQHVVETHNNNDNTRGGSC